MLWILGRVESNPGPSIKIGSLNTDSILNKGPLVVNLIKEHRLDALECQLLKIRLGHEGTAVSS